MASTKYLQNLLKDETSSLISTVKKISIPGGLGNAAGGRREYLLPLAKAGLSKGIAGLFIEAHPDPDLAKCDGPCAISTDEIPTVLSQLSTLDEFIKNQERNT